MRQDGRNTDELRPITITPNFTENPAGSVLIRTGNTMVLCTATVEDKVPPFLRGSGKGWVTAEYSLLPGSTGGRTAREAAKGKITGRTAEIQRLIGRSLRAVLDLEALGEKTIWLDCDVLQADGGTRTASVNGAFIALSLAVKKMLAEGLIEKSPILDSVSAISVGIIDGTPMLDLPYVEDSNAEVDMNIVMTGGGRFVEIQGTGEEATFDDAQLAELLRLAKKGLKEISTLQMNILQGGWRQGEEAIKQKIVLATHNVNKIAEIKVILKDFLIEVVSSDEVGELPEVIEDGLTFEDNAVKKAKSIAAFTGMLSLADDSGLVVDAIDGAPGVFSARFAGEPTDDSANNAKLLKLLENTPNEERTGRFVCTIAVASPDGRVKTVSGSCEGHILRELHGSNGFGYDPLFVPEGHTLSFAELNGEQKNAISHRGRALAKLPEILPDFL